MTITFQQMFDNVNNLATAHGLDQIDDDYTAELRNHILGTIEQILGEQTLFQVYGENLPQGSYTINEETPLSRETITGIYEQIESMLEQTTMMGLLKNILSSAEEDTLNDLIEKYNILSEEEFLTYANTVISTQGPGCGLPIFGIVELVNNEMNFILAIKEVLKQYGFNPDTPAIKETTELPQPIKSFLDDVRKSILSHISEKKDFFLIENATHSIN